MDNLYQWEGLLPIYPSCMGAPGKTSPCLSGVVTLLLRFVSVVPYKHFYFGGRVGHVGLEVEGVGHSAGQTSTTCRIIKQQAVFLSLPQVYELTGVVTEIHESFYRLFLKTS